MGSRSLVGKSEKEKEQNELESLPHNCLSFPEGGEREEKKGSRSCAHRAKGYSTKEERVRAHRPIHLLGRHQWGRTLIRKEDTGHL